MKPGDGANTCDALSKPKKSLCRTLFNLKRAPRTRFSLPGRFTADRFRRFVWPYIRCRVRRWSALLGVPHNQKWANWYNFGTNAMCRCLFFYDRP